MQTLNNSSELKLRRVFDAKRERVFHAWTDPASVMRWFGCAKSTMLEAKIDLRVGGQYAFSMNGPMGPMTVVGTYREVTPPERLVFSWAWDGEAPADAWDSEVTVEFEALAENRTEVRITHSGLPSEMAQGHNSGWEHTLDVFARVLAEAR